MLYDVIVLGAGAMGSATAYYLSKAGQRVLLIEQFQLNHQKGSSYGLSRIIRYAYDNPAYITLAKAAYPLWLDLQEEAGETLYTQTGSIDFGLHNETILQDTSNSLSLENIPFESLTPTEASDRFPQFRFDENMSILYQKATGILAASKCVLAHIRLAKKLGAIILAETPVTDVVVHSNSVEVRTPNQTYTAAKLVMTTGAWTKALLAMHGLDLPLTVMPSQVAFFETDKLENYEPGHFPIFFAYLKGIYGKGVYGIPSQDGSGVKISTIYGWRTFSDPTEVNYIPDDDWVETLRNFIRQYIPGANGQVLSSRICLYTMTPDTHFVIDRHPVYPHIVFGTGFSGHGFKFSTLIGSILTDLVLKGKTEHDISLFKASRWN